MQLKSGSELQNGKYRIVKTLGQGGFGITYLAEQVALNRKVAIKEFFMKEYCERDGDTSHVMLGTTAGSKELVFRFRTKFVREAQMIAGLDHPHIVKIHDVFEENGTAYYVMEFLEGDSLSDRVKRSGPLPEKEALRYIRQVGDALSYLHGQNCLHFDVKPLNILVNKSGNAVLIDFGVSKHYDEGGSQTSSTPVGISKGYAPLEQYQQNEISTFTPATDVYALGATLYTLVTGSVPPSASEVNEEGVPPMPGKISKATRDAIEKALQPRRKDRPQSVAAFLQLLDTPAQKPQRSRKSVVEKPAAEEPDDEATIFPGKLPASKSAQTSKSKPSTASSQTTSDKTGKPKSWSRAFLAGVVVVGAIFAFVFWGKKTNETPSMQQDMTENPTTNRENGHEWVDLGLSVKWATCNVGASLPSEYGNYYAWGETNTKSFYSWSTFHYCSDTTGVSFTKYNTQSGYGTVDNKIRLDLSDDAARVNWGGSWRMPTGAEFDELRYNCTWTWTTQGGKNGYKVTSRKNGNSIFFPAAGRWDGNSVNGAGSYGYYWSSSLNSDYPNYARYLYYLSSSFSSSNYGRGRYSGFSVRPVTE